jgi:hypothetical protein
MLPRLGPDERISAADIARGKASLIRDAAFASLAGSLHGGVILVGFALAAGASALQVGILASAPLIAQATQFAWVALIEHFRQRRFLAIVSVGVARSLILLLAFIPYAITTEARVPVLIAAELTISILGSITGCSLNSWLHQLLPPEGLGRFFSKRLFWGTMVGSAGVLSAGYLIDHWPFGNALHAYSVTFAAAALAGALSTMYLARVPEPAMKAAGPAVSIWEKFQAPFRDRTFRTLLLFIGSWNAASNFAAPFITVYLMQQLGYSLGTVTALTVTSQFSNAFTLYAWGRVSDRLSDKAVLAVVVPLYFTCVIGLVVAAFHAKSGLALPALFFIHLVMGAATGGIGLATGNASLRIAPKAQGTAYLAAVGMTASICGGIAPIIGGAVAEWLAASQLSVVVRWASLTRAGEFAVIDFRHWEFLFVMSAAAGLYVIHALWRLPPGHEIARREVVQEFAIEALRTVNQLSSIAGLITGLFTFGRLRERRLARR